MLVLWNMNKRKKKSGFGWYDFIVFVHKACHIYVEKNIVLYIVIYAYVEGSEWDGENVYMNW